MPNPTIRPGELRERVTLQRYTSTPVSGDPVETERTWAAVGTSVRAKVEPLTAGEATRNGQPASTQPHRVTIRSRTLDVRPKDRLLWHGVGSRADTTLEVVSAADVDARRHVTVVMTQAYPE